MDYQWDTGKAQTNLQKHAIDFADAVVVLEDDSAITLKDDSSDEERFITIGMDALARVLVIVYTWRGDSIRLVSARKATPGERKRYEGESSLILRSF